VERVGTVCERPPNARPACFERDCQGQHVNQGMVLFSAALPAERGSSGSRQGAGRESHPSTRSHDDEHGGYRDRHVGDAVNGATPDAHQA